MPAKIKIDRARSAKPAKATTVKQNGRLLCYVLTIEPAPLASITVVFDSIEGAIDAISNECLIDLGPNETVDIRIKAELMTLEEFQSLPEFEGW